jgi:hypothetical protein
VFGVRINGSVTVRENYKMEGLEKWELRAQLGLGEKMYWKMEKVK